MIVRAFAFEDWQQIDLQPQQEYLRAFVNDDYFRSLSTDYAITVIADDKIIALAGIKQTEQGGFLWSFVSCHAGQHMIAIHRVAARMIECFSEQLIATTECDFDHGDRWLKMLGFEYAGLEPNFGPDGRDHRVYVH